MIVSPYRVAHLTDLHARDHLPGTSLVGRRRSREGLLERALQAIGQQRVDLLVITGDLLDVPLFLVDGAPKGFEGVMDENAWLAAVKADYRAMREVLDATGLPYRVLPGNHDQVPLFTEVFGDQGEELRAGGYRWITFVDHEQEGNCPRRLGAARHLLDRVLGDADATPQVHLQHYLLNTPAAAAGGYPYAYAEEGWLRHRLEASGRVRLSLSGHYHPGTAPEAHGGVHYAVGEALCEAPYRWRVYELTQAGINTEYHALPAAVPCAVVFLDRDGVINDLAAYAYGAEQMRLVPGSARAIRQLNEAGVRVVVVTSQSAIGMGYVTAAVVNMVNERMQQLLAEEGAYLDAIYYTAGAGEDSVLPDMQTWPTAKSGLIETAFAELPLLREGAWIIGDRLTDIEAGREAGIAGMLVRTGCGGEQEAAARKEGVPVADDLQSAVTELLERRGLRASACAIG